MAVSDATQRGPRSPPPADAAEAGIRISDAATRVGVSARTLRYYEELGLLTPSLYTPGGERRYTPEDLAHLAAHPRAARGARDEPRRDPRVPVPRDEARRAAGVVPSHEGSHDARRRWPSRRRRSQEALVLNESLAEQISAKLARMDGFRAKLTQ